jgi:hypothetical protein
VSKLRLFDAMIQESIRHYMKNANPKVKAPQRNGKVERKFQTFFGRIRLMLNDAGLKDGLRLGVWALCAIIIMSVKY